MEQWSKIKGFEGYVGVQDWEVSDQGNVRQFGRPVIPQVDSQGYPYIRFCTGGELQRVHRLMLLAFEGPPPEGFIAVKHNGIWRWGPRDMVQIPKRKVQTLKVKKKKTIPERHPHFRRWLEKKTKG